MLDVLSVVLGPVAAPVCRLIGVRRVGPFRVAAQIASGRRTEVYLAAREHFDGAWLLRELKPGHSSRAFARDVTRTTSFGGSVPYEGAEDFDQTFVAYGRPVIGESLATILDATLSGAVTLPLPLAVSIIVETAHALVRAGPRRPHGDLVPPHILVGYDGTVQLIDPAGEEALERGKAAGREAYRSPEHVRGEPITAASDVFVLGILLYELTSATRLFEGSLAEVSAAITIDPYQRPRADVSDPFPIELHVALRKMLRPQQAARFSDAATAIEALNPAITDAPELRRHRISRWMRSSFRERYLAWAHALRTVGDQIGETPEAEIDLEPTEGFDHPTPRGITIRQVAEGALRRPLNIPNDLTEPAAAPFSLNRESTVVDARQPSDGLGADDPLSPSSREATQVNRQPSQEEVTTVSELPERARTEPEQPLIELTEIDDADLMSIDEPLSAPPRDASTTPREIAPPGAFRWDSILTPSQPQEMPDHSEAATPLPELDSFESLVQPADLSPAPAPLHLAADLIDPLMGADFSAGDGMATVRSPTPGGSVLFNDPQRLPSDEQSESTTPLLVPGPRRVHPRMESLLEEPSPVVDPTPKLSAPPMSMTPATDSVVNRMPRPVRSTTMVVRQRLIPRDAVRHEVDLHRGASDDAATLIPLPIPSAPDLEPELEEPESLVVPVAEADPPRRGRAAKRLLWVLVGLALLLGSLAALWAVRGHLGMVWPLAASGVQATGPKSVHGPAPVARIPEPPQTAPAPEPSVTSTVTTDPPPPSVVTATVGEGRSVPNDPAPTEEASPEEQPSPEEPSGRASGRKSKLPGPGKKSIQVSVFPRYAAVLVDGVQVENGTHVPLGKAPRTIEISAANYERYRSVLDPGRKAPLDVVLRRRAQGP